MPPRDGSGTILPARISAPAPAARLRLGAGVGLLTVAALLVFRELGIWWSDALVWPLVLAVGGVALLWAQSRERRGREPPPPLPSPARRASRAATRDRRPRARFFDLYRGGFGVALVVGAALLFLSQNDALGAARDAAFTAIVAIFALALILAPFIWRLGRNLATERAERIRSQERADLAAHLHDSVLQTLTLMQKRADDPREVAALARRQERELRSWLAAGEPRASGRRLRGRAAGRAEEVEDAHRVKIEVVAVGDCELDERAAAVVGAAREALTNAAKFAGEDGPISVYAEVGDERIEAFVRDRGPGFDPEAVPADRRGVRESIVGRMRRHGGDCDDLLRARSRNRGGAWPSSGRQRERAADDRDRRRPRALPQRRPRRGRGARRRASARRAASRRPCALIGELKPDVVLLDVHMPGGGGVEVIRQVVADGAGAALPGALGLRRGRGRDRRRSRRRPRLRDEVDLRRGAGRRRQPGPRRRRRLLAAPRRLRPRRLRRDRSRRPRSIPSSTS